MALLRYNPNGVLFYVWKHNCYFFQRFLSPRKAFLADEVKPHLKQPQLTAPDAQTSLIHREKPQDRVGVEKTRSKDGEWGSLLIWSITRKLGKHRWSSSPTHFWKIGKKREPRQEKGQNIEHQCPVHLIYHHSKSWFWENTFWHHHENTCLGMMGLDWGCLLNHF